MERTGSYGDQEMVKLFVGQVPRTYEADDLKQIFEEFGRVQSVSIIRDKVTGSHRGCAFVTLDGNAALRGQAALHEKRVLPGMACAMQVKPAENDRSTEERKLFIGMISKKASEEDIRILFTPYGNIEEVTILRGPDGLSKGCAFVKFALRLQAQNAIMKMHNSMTMEGCSSPIVVKVADSEKQKQSKRIQAFAQNMAMTPGSNMSGYQQQVMTPNPPSHPSSTPAGPHAGAGLLAMLAIQQQQCAALAATVMNLQNQLQSQGPGAPLSQSSVPMQQAVLPAGRNDSLTQMHGIPSGNGTFQAYPSMPNVYNNQLISQMSKVGLNKEGPEGCNLFIYHLPTDMGDAELLNMFAPYGNIVSCKVFIDKATRESKGFGFVSYDNPSAASTAIQALNGFQIGMKRLKVQLKRSKESGRPY